MTDLKVLREVAEKATPGPWEVLGQALQNGGRLAPIIKTVYGSPYNDESELTPITMLGQGRRQMDNAEFVATFDPPMVLALLDRLIAAEHDLERTHAALTRERVKKNPHIDAIATHDAHGNLLPQSRLIVTGSTADGAG